MTFISSIYFLTYESLCSSKKNLCSSTLRVFYFPPDGRESSSFNKSLKFSSLFARVNIIHRNKLVPPLGVKFINYYFYFILFLLFLKVQVELKKYMKEIEDFL